MSREFPPESSSMKFFRRLGLDSIAWSLRRLHCPVEKSALVLEVGSGGNPYYRANVLLDAYEETRERHWVPLVQDRPTVLGFVENLPFRDKAFDFVIASHVLEHSRDPEKFLGELQRVARAGYIEVPDAFMERINPYRDHRLEITVRDGALRIRKKQAWLADETVVELYEHRVKKILTRETMRKHPFDFHVRYYWRDRIDYVIENPGTDNGWEAPAGDDRHVGGGSLRGAVAGRIIKVMRKLLSQHRRNKEIDLVELMQCPSCHSGELSSREEGLMCNKCGMHFDMQSGLPVMTVTRDEQHGQDRQ